MKLFLTRFSTRLVSLVEQLRMIQEAELVRVPVVEHREEESESESHEVSVASSECHMSSEQNPELASDRDSPVGLLECGVGNLNAAGLLVSNACALSSSSAVLGDAGAALALVLGSVPGGVRKVKSMNCLVEVLASPKQRHTVVAARSRKGRGRPTKFCALVDVGSDIVNASLTDFDIQGRWIPKGWACGMVSVYTTTQLVNQTI
ncbi:hypothetical protein V6N12_067779 [Hibiscus sabdariffa]|uniref:Uncharacterized protein n=1 Tax=Hibiscus sabdariffa TaxID=183260 RepID=A0ABR2FN20_9ROSI